MLGKLIPHLALVPEHAAVRMDDEVATTSLDELDLCIGELLADRRGQTGRLGFVVSLHAVGDRNVHWGLRWVQC